MRDYTFVTKTTPSIKAVMRTDTIDDLTKRFTIMWMEGVKDTWFESIIPWDLGSVVTTDEVETWFESFQSEIDGYIYGGEQIQVLGVPTHVLTLTPTIVNGTQADFVLTGTKTNAETIEDVIHVTTVVAKTLQIIEGYSYSFSLPRGSWTSGSAPTPFVCSVDKAVALGITLPQA